MDNKTRILFIPEAVTAAHVGRCLMLASFLDPRHYEIIFASSYSYQKLVEDKGFAQIKIVKIARSSRNLI
ncbi:MAG: hypothetical protein L6420_01930 [Elusimicrobia bacterium]|nr:hypothetical protein [Candidatus Omnitrophota bacterium]MCG2725011.1 hypothetical protein [Elusimicrobiota bacterium]